MNAKITPKAVLRSNLLFRDLPDAAIELIATLAARRKYPKGSMIFSQGDPGDALYGVVSGEVRISAGTPDGREVFFNVMKPGDSFGEIAFLDGKVRTASAQATVESDLMMIRRHHFADLMARDPQLPIHLLTLLCERLRWTSELVEDSAFLSVPARLAKRLLTLAHPRGTIAARSPTVSISQGDLAHFLSVSRQSVNHHLQEWRRQGWIDVARLRIVIRDAEALTRIAAGPS